MNKELKKSIEDLKAFNKLFSAVQVVADACEDIKSLESSAFMAENRHKKALKELGDVKDASSAASKELALAKQAKKDLEDKCSKLVIDSEKKRDEILSEANIKKDEILLEVSELRKKADLLANGMSADIVKLKKEISDKQAELDDLKSKIASTKESLRNLIG